MISSKDSYNYTFGALFYNMKNQCCKLSKKHTDPNTMYECNQQN